MRAAVGIVAAALVGAALTGCVAAEPSVPPGPTDEETLAYWQASMDDYWNSISQLNPKLVKPDIPFTGFIVDPDKRSHLVTDCQLDRGLYFDPGGAAPDQQPGSVDLIYYTCEMLYPQDPRTFGYLTEDQLNWLYDFLAHRVAPCVELHGFPVPAPPTREQYVDPGTWLLYSWSPYGQVPGEPGDAVWDAVYQGCPRLPDDQFQFLQGVLTTGHL